MKPNSLRLCVFLRRVLNVLKKYPGTSPAFLEAAATVPTWPFLRWTSQLMAVKSNARVAEELLAPFFLCVSFDGLP